MSLIPKKIHYCWFGGKEKPKLVKECIKTWKEKMPNYEIIEWNEKNFDVNKIRFTKEAYENKKWAFVADYCRNWVLYNYGGIYLDTDMEVLKPLDRFLEDNSFAGVEDDENINAAIWGCKKGDKFVKLILNYYEMINFEDYKQDLFSLAIPKIITKIAKENGYNKSITPTNFYNKTVIYPKEYFYPKRKSWEKEIVTKNTYTIHHYDGSWRSKNQIFFSNIKKVMVKFIGIKKANLLVDFIKGRVKK
ncbi:glycosyltransferase family 32 protein [Clostridium perfringens]|uniref:glycosyltransferase family 32 protein n=1 Tax=Clostridium perfringens TaxID=1502 RepID=UPI0014594E7A|nr:glycosyltransferase [Clostridium perfringens]NMF21133.1 mannosyltransferase [Clostridium perfringens]